MTTEEERNDEINISEKQTEEEDELAKAELNLPSIFDRYMLTTDVPFTGVRTTKAKIEPIKVPVTEKLARGNSNAKINGDSISNSMSARRFQPTPSKGKLIHSASSKQMIIMRI